MLDLERIIDELNLNGAIGIADVWHEGSKKFYRAVLLKELTPEEALGPDL